MLHILPGKFGSLAMALLLALCANQAPAKHLQTPNIIFVNVADSTQGLSGFSQFPAINNRGAVAFVATQNGTGQVFKWDRHGLRTIASTADNPFTFFSDNVVMNDAGVVGFQASLNAVGRASGIFTSDGVSLKTIVDSSNASLGLSGFGLGSPSINASGTVAFQAPRIGLRSSLIFTGDGESLTPVLDTLTSEFGDFGSVAINASGQIVFRGILRDRNEGVFVATPILNQKEKGGSASALPASVIAIVDSTNPDFFDFGDPVINDAGTIADFAEVSSGVEILSGNGNGITARTDPTSGLFIDFEHPSINNHGAVAFSAFESSGAQGIFVELTGHASPIPVLQTGDPLFGSTVTAVSVGRFAFSNNFRLVFEYELVDGRSGIAIAVIQRDREAPGNEDDGDK